MKRLAVAVLGVAALAAGCGDRGQVAEPEPRTFADGRFPHARHGRLACTDCHARDAVLAGRPARPGADDHAPCDRGECHREAFLAPPGELCQMCHESVDPTGEGTSPLRRYPPTTGLRALASRFSHRRHLDYGRIERQVGFHVSCTDCHRVNEDGELAPPDHAACARCHAPEAAPPDTPSMDRCEGCHVERPGPPARRRDLITGDLRFDHANHRTDRTSTRISCTECHTRTDESEEVGHHPDPRTAACVACHDDADRTPRPRRMSVCETCHATRTRGLGSLPPRSHLPARERPEDHTLAFRRDHATEARTESARCSRCHSFMSGSPRATCDECHQVMRPRDHTVTWREYDHGPAAATSADRCATCHVGTFCTACHSVPPRSHIPRMSFREGGHGQLARYNLRSCTACHVVDQFCTECHTRRRRP